MLVKLKELDAKRIYLCGRIIEADDAGCFEVTEDEYALNEMVLEPLDKKAGKVVKPLEDKEAKVKETEPETKKAKK
jgi:hypothetical protein